MSEQEVWLKAFLAFIAQDVHIDAAAQRADKTLRLFRERF